MANGPINGSKIFEILFGNYPSWIKLIVTGVVIGVFSMVLITGQRDIKNELSAIRYEVHLARNADSLRWLAMDTNIKRVMRQGDQVHLRLWRAVGRETEHQNLE